MNVLTFCSVIAVSPAIQQQIIKHMKNKIFQFPFLIIIPSQTI